MQRTGYLVLAAALSIVGGARAQSASNEATAYFAGGCFWGVEYVFEHVRGVRSAVSGFAHGADSGATGPLRPNHGGYAETVRVTYDPSQVTYEQLLRVFFLVAHDPTQLDRQGPDVGYEYRSTVFFETSEQRDRALAMIAGPRSDSRGEIVTEVVRFRRFSVAPAAHQNYSVRHLRDPYVVINDLPKIANLRRDFPQLFVERPATADR